MRTDWMILIASSICIFAAVKVIVLVYQFKIWLNNITHIVLDGLIEALGGEEDD